MAQMPEPEPEPNLNMTTKTRVGTEGVAAKKKLGEKVVPGKQKLGEAARNKAGKEVPASKPKEATVHGAELDEQIAAQTHASGMSDEEEDEAPEEKTSTAPERFSRITAQLSQQSMSAPALSRDPDRARPPSLNPMPATAVRLNLSTHVQPLPEQFIGVPEEKLGEDKEGEKEPFLQNDGSAERKPKHGQPALNKHDSVEPEREPEPVLVANSESGGKGKSRSKPFKPEAPTRSKQASVSWETLRAFFGDGLRGQHRQQGTGALKDDMHGKDHIGRA